MSDLRLLVLSGFRYRIHFDLANYCFTNVFAVGLDLIDCRYPVIRDRLLYRCQPTPMLLSRRKHSFSLEHSERGPKHDN
jgi:hypothetical protein